jgi:ABC-2 type transport system ATP-binding protein
VNDKALVLKGIRKAFAGHVAVADLSLEVPRNSIFGLLGPNGAGKTTTLRMVMNILGTDAGTIEILGKPADHASRDRIGYMPEERGLYPRMVLEEQLLFMAAIKGVPAKQARERIGPWLERLSLADWRKRKTNELSKGMQQKAQFIATVLHQPDVLIVDEPMSGLDPVGRKEIRDLIVGLNAQGKTVFMNTHILSDVEMICDRVAIIVNGRIAYEGVLDGLHGDRRQFDVTLAGLPPDFAEEVEAQLGARLGGRGERVTLRLPEKEMNEWVGAALVRGARIEEIAPHREDLETLFLRAVEAQQSEEKS